MCFQRLKDMRKDSGKTQREIAEYLKCDQSLYSKYERGERDIPVYIIVKLVYYYNTNVDYLVGLTDIQKPYDRSKLK